MFCDGCFPNYPRMRQAEAARSPPPPPPPPHPPPPPTPGRPCSTLFNAAWGPISVIAFEEGVEPLLVFYVCRTGGGREVLAHWDDVVWAQSADDACMRCGHERRLTAVVLLDRLEQRLFGDSAVPAGWNCKKCR